MNSDQKFYGVDRGWMQAQWRDCADKAEQLKIFRDMVGGRVPVQEILDAVGEPEYCGPLAPEKRNYRCWTSKDDERIAELVREGRTYSEIAAEFGVKSGNIGWRISWLRSRGMIPPSENTEGKTEKADTEPEDVPEKPDAYPDGGALPLEIGDLPGADALETVGQTLRALLDEEEMLCDRVAVVRDTIAAYRERLRELLAMAGGGIVDT